MELTTHLKDEVLFFLQYRTIQSREAIKAHVKNILGGFTTEITHDRVLEIIR